MMGITGVTPENIERITVTTPAGATTPLIHSKPTTGLEGKFSLEYAIAATLLDGYPDLDSFTDAAVQRPQARRLMEAVSVVKTDGGDGLLAGEVTIEARLSTGELRSATLATPPGAPDRPPTDHELRRKVGQSLHLTWDEAAAELHRRL
jgi:2-methylcitrate dehydratase PrpD